MQHEGQLLDERQLVTAEDTNASRAEKDSPEEQRAMPSLEDVGIGVVEDEEALDLCSSKKRGTTGRGYPA